MKKKIKSFLLKPAFLLSAAAVLLAASALGSAQAALTYYSENYSAQMNISSIGVSLMENDQRVSYRDYEHQDDSWNESQGRLLEHLLDDEKEEKIIPGKEYREQISVSNSGDIDTYVRVILYKDWQDANGRRDTSLSPDLINLKLNLGKNWILDEKASTTERTVLYYTGILPAGESTGYLSKTLKIDSEIAAKANETVSVNEQGHKTITTEFAYDGYQFNLSAEVDAVQTHNAQEAIKSAWGVDVNIAANGTLSLQ